MWLLLLLLLAAAASVARAELLRPAMPWAVNNLTPDAYDKNLKAIRDSVLPQNWVLSPVLKWDAYGHKIARYAGVVAAHNLTSCIIYNKEAVAALSKAPQLPGFWRILPDAGPARYEELFGAASKGLRVVELLSPLNAADLLAAARDSGRRIAVNVFLGAHYMRPWGYDFDTPAQLSGLLASLDPAWLEVKGFMAHMGTLGVHEANVRKRQAAMAQRFLAVACPVALELAATQHVSLSYASTTDFNRLPRSNGMRMLPDEGLCGGQHPNITHVARFGRLTYKGVGAKAAAVPAADDAAAALSPAHLLALAE